MNETVIIKNFKSREEGRYVMESLFFGQYFIEIADLDLDDTSSYWTVFTYDSRTRKIKPVNVVDSFEKIF